MYYGIYKEIRDSAWKCLLDFQIDSLPVDILKIARAADIRVIRDSIVNDLSPTENGKSYFDGQNWTIIYNDLNSIEISRYTIAHELGHIFLGHELKYAKYIGTAEIKSKPKSEQQADLFATRVLCPACILWRLNLHTPEEITRYCKVEYDIAVKRAKRMEALYRRNKFLTNSLENDIYDRFQPYLQKVKN